MKEKLATALVFIIGFAGFLFWFGEPPTNTQEIINKVIGTVLIGVAILAYKRFVNKGVIEEDNKII